MSLRILVAGGRLHHRRGLRRLRRGRRWPGIGAGRRDGPGDVLRVRFHLGHRPGHRPLADAARGVARALGQAVAGGAVGAGSRRPSSGRPCPGCSRDRPPAEAAAGARSAVPAGTQLLGISLHGGVATVDLTSEFEGDGAARQRLGLAQLVYGVTQFPTVHALRLHLDGQPVTAFADGLVLPDPITRTSMGFPRLVPAITVASPRPGASVRAPFTVSGIADVFEAGLTYRLLDASGHELSGGAAAASCGTGCAGTFSFTIPGLGVSSDQPGTLVITGGGHVVRLPLHLVPPFDVTLPRPGATLTSPTVIAFRYPSAGQVVLRIFDAHFHLLGRRVVSAICIGPCPRDVEYRNHVHFSVAGLQRGYVEISPLHPKPHASGQVVEIPVALNGG